MTRTLRFNNVYINDSFLLIGKDENNKNIRRYDYLLDDYYFKCKTFEDAEIKMQSVTTQKIIVNNHLAESNIDFLIGGDLNNQIAVSSYAAQNFKIPFIGVYSACATFVESLIISASLIQTNQANNIVSTVSSHTLTAERQFRFPIEYGNNRPMSSTVTATGCISALISDKPDKIAITSGTIGEVVNLGQKDTNHMGAVMAPACANTLYTHLSNLGQKPNDYDLIITGDLGKIGIQILREYYEETFHQKLNNIIDAGSVLYEKNQEKYSGGSGPCCLPIILFGKILPMKKYKKILILGTGSLHNSVLVNQKRSIPSVCHAISLEVNYGLS